MLIKVGDLVQDCDGYYGIVVAVDHAYDLYAQLAHPEIFENDGFPLEYQFVTVFCFHESSEMVFFDSELQILSRA